MLMHKSEVGRMPSIRTQVGAPVRAVLAAFLVASVASTSPTISAQAAGPWKSLFNGKDFTGWTVIAGGGGRAGSATAPVSAPAAPAAPRSTNPEDRGWKI